MKKLTALVLFACACVVLVFAQSPSKDPTDIEAVKQVELGMGDAMVAGDIDKLNHIYADDFATVSDGKVITKEILLTDFKSFHDKLEWYEDGFMNVQVFGNVALAQGSVKEKLFCQEFLLCSARWQRFKTNYDPSLMLFDNDGMC